MSAFPQGVPQLSSRLRHLVGKALADFRMIAPGSGVMVGLSGGKDSLVLLEALAALRSRSPVPFSLRACTLDPSDGALDTSFLEARCDALDVPWTLLSHDLLGIIRQREERSPCSFCATMRRGMLCSAATAAGCALLALGHHLDDAVETTLLNLVSGGRFRCFAPRTWHSRSRITVIRPLVYLQERHIRSEVQRLGLLPVAPPCPYAGGTERARIKELLALLQERYPDIRSNVLHALQNIRQEDCWGFADADLNAPEQPGGLENGATLHSSALPPL